MDHADAQIEIALLASVEQQANATAAALERVRDLMREVAAECKKQQQAYNSKKKKEHK